MSDKVQKNHIMGQPRIKFQPMSLVFDFVQEHKEWFAIVIVLTAIKYFISNFDILFVLFTTTIGGTIGALQCLDNMKDKAEQKTGPAKCGATLFFMSFFHIIAVAGLVFGGMIGLTVGCCSILIWNLWVLGYYIQVVIALLMISFTILKLLQHKKYGKWWIWGLIQGF